MSGDALAPILVVDDEPYNRDVLGQELDGLGYRCREARSGEDALAILRAEPVELVLLDIMMPGMDGFGVLSTLRREGRQQDVPVIVVSALHDMPSVVRGIELGAVDYLPKPFEPALLKARVETCIERRRWRAREQDYLAEIDRQRSRAEGLLATLLPAEAIGELQTTGRVAPRAHDDVAVMFLDVVGFTELTLTTQPAELVEALGQLAEMAERCADVAGLEKIKMVGDAVMITGNLLRAHDAPVEGCVSCAQALFAEVRALGPAWQLRGGLSYGPAISGVIGRERYGFDLWGPYVNAAARLAGLPGASQLHIDARAMRRLGSRPGINAVGSIPLKGLGSVKVYRVSFD